MGARQCGGVVDPLFEARFHLLEGVPAPSLAVPPTPEQVASRAEYDLPFGPVLDLPDVTISDAVAPGPHGPVPVRIYRRLSDADARACLVWIHGGAFLFGDLDMPEADHVARRVAAWADCVVVSVDYRLALGGVHFPVPHDDCYAAYLWTRASASELGIDPSRIAVGGGSAGGNLAASVALRARDSGTPAWQSLLAYPAVHATAMAISDELAECLAKIPVAIQYGTDDTITMNYLGGPVESATPYAFPALADSLVGYPATFIETSEFDPLRGSGEEFAAMLRRDGVEVEYVVACGVPHGHLNMIGLPQGVDGCARLSARMRRPA